LFGFGTKIGTIAIIFYEKVNFAKSSLHFTKKLRNFARNFVMIAFVAIDGIRE